MAVTVPPLFLQAGDHPARSVRALIAEMYDEGVMNLAALKVTQRASGGANYSVDVSAGRCVVTGDNIPTWQGNYMGINDDVVNLVPTSVPSAGNTRIDSVCFQIRDDAEDSGSINDARLYIKAGTPASSGATAPALGNNEIRLANITITSATTTITDAAISDQRTVAGRRCMPGTIEWLSVSTVPSGWISADGVNRNRADYPALAAAYEAMGWPYGAGNGTTTFGVPDLRGKVAVPVRSGQSQVDTIGETGGEYTHTLTTGELPSHSHPMPHTHTMNHDHPSTAVMGAGVPIGTGGNTAAGATTYRGITIDGSGSPHTVDVPNYTGSTGGASTANTSNTGSGTAHNVMQPYVVVGLAVIRT